MEQEARQQVEDWNLLMAEKIVMFRLYWNSGKVIAVEFYTKAGCLRLTCPPYTPVTIEEFTV